MSLGFYITGMPRSGTKFLAMTMASDPSTNVLHSPHVRMRRSVESMLLLSSMMIELTGKRTGIICPHSLGIVKNIGKRARRGVIIRDIRMCALSQYNYAMERGLTDSITPDNFRIDREIFHSLVSTPGVIQIQFDRMVGDRAYLGSICRGFGVHKISPLGVIDPAGRRHAATWEDLPDEWREVSQ